MGNILSKGSLWDALIHWAVRFECIAEIGLWLHNIAQVALFTSPYTMFCFKDKESIVVIFSLIKALGDQAALDGVVIY